MKLLPWELQDDAERNTVKISRKIYKVKFLHKCATAIFILNLLCLFQYNPQSFVWLSIVFVNSFITLTATTIWRRAGTVNVQTVVQLSSLARFPGVLSLLRAVRSQKGACALWACMDMGFWNCHPKPGVCKLSGCVSKLHLEQLAYSYPVMPSRIRNKIHTSQRSIKMLPGTSKAQARISLDFTWGRI